MLDSHLSPLPSVLVTGANGFLGSGIVRRALATGLPVLATDKNSTSVVPNVGYARADIRDLPSLGPIMRGVSHVIHAAGLAHVFNGPKAALAPFKEINEMGTAHVAAAAASSGVSHFVLISSVSVYGPCTKGAYDESALSRPVGAYAESKYAAEQRAIEVAQSSGMALTILRLATLYGEGDRGNVARLMRAIDRYRFIWVGDGSNLKSLLHRDDAACACLAASQALGAGIRTFNVAAAAVPMREVVEVLASELGRRVPPWHVPASLALWLAGGVARVARGRGRLATLYPAVEKWLADDAYDGRKFERAYSFRASVTLEEGLRREVAWHKGQTAQG